MTTEYHPLRQERILDEAGNLAAIWRDLGPMGRRMVNEHVGHDLYKALHALAIEVEERVPLKTVENGAPAGAPASREDPEPAGYPAEKRIANLEGFLEARHVRREALHHARKSFEQHTEDPWTHARDVVVVAQVFEKYLIGNAKDEETAS